MPNKEKKGMKYRRTVMWEYTREYNTFEEAENDENNMLKDTIEEVEK